MDNMQKNRKREEQERFEEADNAGRFAGNGPDSNSVRQQAVESIRQDTNSTREERDQGNSDAGARRDPAQVHDHKGESQNVNDDTGRPLNDQELEKARNKAAEGLRQGRNNS